MNLSFRIALSVAPVAFFPLGSLRASPQSLKLSHPGIVDGISTFAASPDGKSVVYSDREGFYGVQIDTPGSSTSISPADWMLPANGFFAMGTEILFTPDSREVFFSAAIEADTTLYRAPVDGSGPASTVFQSTSIGGYLGSIRKLQLTPAGDTVLFEYVNSSPTNGPTEPFPGAYAMPLDGSSPPVRIGGGTAFQDLFPSGDGTRAIWGTSRIGGTPCLLEAEVRSAPVDGSSPSVRLSPPDPCFNYWGGAQLDATGARVVFRGSDAITFQGFLYSSPVDGSAAPVLLDSNVTADLLANPMTPQVAWGRVVGTNLELVHGPADGSAPPVVLATLALGRQIEGMAFTRDGSKLVYLADADVAGRFELYGVPTDGSQAPTKINDPLVAGGSVTFDPNGGGGHFRLSPDETRVVFRADLRIDGRFELWSAPIDGSGPTILLHNPLSAGLQIYPDFILLSNSRDLLYRGEPNPDLIPVWLARIDQTGPFKLRSGPFANHPTEVLEGFRVTPGEGHVLYLADQETDGLYELYAHPLYKRQKSSNGIRGIRSN